MTASAWVLAAAALYACVELVTRAWLTRTAIKEIVRFFVLFELAVLSLMRRIVRPGFVLTGECQRRGECCKHIVGNPPSWVKGTRLLGAFVAFHRIVHNFHVAGRGEDGEVIFACDHLQTDGRCGIYRYRPFICRNYPVQPFFGPPGPLVGCGYGVASRRVLAMRARPSLRILNSVVGIHHPTRAHPRDRIDDNADFERISLDIPSAAP